MGLSMSIEDEKTNEVLQNILALFGPEVFILSTKWVELEKRTRIVYTAWATLDPGIKLADVDRHYNDHRGIERELFFVALLNFVESDKAKEIFKLLHHRVAENSIAIDKSLL